MLATLALNTSLRGLAPSFVYANTRMIYLPCGQFSLPRGSSTLGTSQHTAILTAAVPFEFLVFLSTPNRVGEAETTLFKAGLPGHVCRMGLKAHAKAEGNKGGDKLLMPLHALC